MFMSDVQPAGSLEEPNQVERPHLPDPHDKSVPTVSYPQRYRMLAVINHVPLQNTLTDKALLALVITPDDNFLQRLIVFR